MAGEVSAHHMRARLGVPALFDQIGQGFVYERLKLPSFGLGKPANRRQDFRIDLGGEFLAESGHVLKVA